MGTAEGHRTEPARPTGEDAETQPAGGSSACEEPTHRAVLKWKERAREVAQRIERGELEQMVEMLMDEDENRRYEVATDIAKGGRAVIPRAIGLAADARPQMREMACYILGQVGYPARDSPGFLIRFSEGIPALIGRLEDDPEPGVRAAAAAALGHQEVPATLPALCRAASDPDSRVRFSAACALGKFHEDAWGDKEARGHREEAIAALLRLMHDEDEDVRDWATFGIHQGSHDTPETRARLWQALDDPCPAVRGEAAVGLAEFGDRSLIPRLDQLLREDKVCSTLFFEAAEELGDPCLLPAVLAGAERWREGMEEGEELNYDISSAIEVLEEAAAARGDGDESRSGVESNPGDESLSRESGQG